MDAETPNETKRRRLADDHVVVIVSDSSDDEKDATDLTNFDAKQRKQQARLAKIENELSDIEMAIDALRHQQDELHVEREYVKSQITAAFESRSGSLRKDWAKHELFKWTPAVNKAKSKLLGADSVFRHNQQEVINATLEGRDTMIIMPTGGGKTLCYLLPAIVEGGLTVVISPLISLIQDQVHLHRAAGISAIGFNGDTPKETAKQILADVANSDSSLKLLFVTPEKFVKSKTLLNKLEKAYDAKKLKRIVIDEVHCCSEWGHDFRPDYQKLNMIKIQFGSIPLMVMTATATPHVQMDIKKTLDLKGCELFVAPTFRKNLFYSVRPKTSSSAADIAGWIKLYHSEEPGIVYCLSQKDTEQLASFLRQENIAAGAYHAGMDTDSRNLMQQHWQTGAIDVIVGTIAFGLGINKLGTRFVIHHSISKSIESLVQESGRAGRDGRGADCVVWYSPLDAMRQSGVVAYNHNGFANLLPLLEYCENVTCCRKSILARRFQESVSNEQCDKHCDVCKTLDFKEIDITEYALLLIKLIENVNPKTLSGIIDLWRGLGRKKHKLENFDKLPKSFTKEHCEHAIIQMLCSRVLGVMYSNTSYSTITYIKKGPNAPKLFSGSIGVTLRIRT